MPTSASAGRSNASYSIRGFSEHSLATPLSVADSASSSAPSTRGHRPSLSIDSKRYFSAPLQTSSRTTLPSSPPSSSPTAIAFHCLEGEPQTQTRSRRRSSIASIRQLYAGLTKSFDCQISSFADAPPRPSYEEQWEASAPLASPEEKGAFDDDNLEAINPLRGQPAGAVPPSAASTGAKRISLRSSCSFFFPSATSATRAQALRAHSQTIRRANSTMLAATAAQEGRSGLRVHANDAKKAPSMPPSPSFSSAPTRNDAQQQQQQQQQQRQLTIRTKPSFHKPRTSGSSSNSSPSNNNPTSVRGIRFDLTAKSGETQARNVHFPPDSASALSDAPFADGVVDRLATRRSTQTNGEPSLPPNVALKLEWPLDVPGYNEEKSAASEAQNSKSSLFGGPTLLYYRQYLEMPMSDSRVSTVKLERSDNAQVGRVLFRITCEMPCWTTASRRYESPICIGVGRAGPTIWEALPTAPKNKSSRESYWTIVQCTSGFKTRVRVENLEHTLFSATGKLNEVYLMHASQEPTIELDRPGHANEVAQFDPFDGFGALHIDARPGNSPYAKASHDPLEFGFIIAMAEVLHAIRDETAGGGKGRRDGRGRLICTKKSGLAKAFGRLFQ